jgi:hypothetical protein
VKDFRPVRHGDKTLVIMWLGNKDVSNFLCLEAMFVVTANGIWKEIQVMNEDGYEEVQKNHCRFLSRWFNFESKQYSVLFSTPQLISSGLTHTNPKFRLHFLWV